MGEMRDSDWSREILLRSDWSGPSVATITTKVLNFIYKEDTSQSLYTNTLYFIYLSSCDDKYRF